MLDNILYKVAFFSIVLIALVGCFDSSNDKEQESTSVSYGETFDGQLQDIIERGDVDAMTQRLDQGLDVNYTLGRFIGAIPLLSAAVGSGHFPMVRLLIERGANINSRYLGFEGKNDSFNPILTACMPKMGLPIQSEIFYYLIDHGADKHSSSSSGSITALLSQQIRNTTYGLNEAKIQGRQTEIALAIEEHKKSLDMLEFLLENGVDANLRYNGHAYTGISGIGDATGLMVGNIDSAKLLLKYGAKLEVKNDQGQTAMFYEASSRSESTEYLKYLIEVGADIFIRDGNNRTPLMVMARPSDDDYSKKIEVLLKAGVNPNIKDINGYTPLQINGGYNPEVVRILKMYGGI